jgi:hypothetical protein
VVANLVTGGHDIGEQILMVLAVVAHHIEVDAQIEPTQRLEDLRGELRIRAVIEGQRHDFLIGGNGPDQALDSATFIRAVGQLHVAADVGIDHLDVVRSDHDVRCSQRVVRDGAAYPGRSASAKSNPDCNTRRRAGRCESSGRAALSSVVDRFLAVRRLASAHRTSHHRVSAR